MIFGTEQVITSSNGLVLVLAAICSGSAATSVGSYLKFKKQGQAQREEIIAAAAEKAVVALQASLTRLEVELKNVKDERDRIERSLSFALMERAKLEERVSVLTRRITELEISVSNYIHQIEVLQTITKDAHPST